MWQNPGEIPGDGKDNDNNGYVDDVYGLDSANGDSDPWDDHSHGTHCSGTIGAVGNNNVGVVGVNWLVRIIAGKFLSSSGSGSISGAVILVDYMTNLKLAGNNIRVLSNSWGGGGFSQSLLDSINRAGDADILFVAAAGNDNTNTDTTPSYPQGYQCVTKANGTPRGYDCVISVASITSTGARSSFSNYGATTVDM
jgi:subtilisin family serine protease